MVSINGIAGDTTLISSNHKKSSTPAFENSLALAKAESLLKNTNQYGRWRRMRQNNPVHAKEVAELVLERCRMLREARGGGGGTDVKRFDEITEQLGRKGVHLFKSHQFREPIFNRARTSVAVKIAAPPSSPVQAKTAAEMASSIPPVSMSLSSGILCGDPLLLYPNKAVEVSEVRETTHTSKSSDISEEVVQLIRNRYLGKHYRKRDCYVFLVRALEDVGVRYYGSGGIKESLLRKAVNEGRQKYAYLTGEGVIQSLCTNPSKIHIPRARDSSFQEAWDRLKSVLSPGSLISVSSRRFGHTGIVGNKGKEWTLLNSAKQVYADERSYKVKEEDLKRELRSWLRRAEKGRSFLTVTVGSPETNMAARFGPDSAVRKVG